jgi:hypothetical protein
MQRSHNYRRLFVAIGHDDIRCRGLKAELCDELILPAYLIGQVTIHDFAECERGPRHPGSQRPVMLGPLRVRRGIK